MLDASTLGQTPLPPLAAYRLDELRAVLETNIVAPLRLVQLALPALRQPGSGSRDQQRRRRHGLSRVGWVRLSKAALDQLVNVLAVEEPGLRVYAVDPGDMRTPMHAEAFPGEDISDRTEPEVVVPALRWLVDANLPSGRYTAAELPGAPA